MPGKQHRQHESPKHTETQGHDTTPAFGDNSVMLAQLRRQAASWPAHDPSSLLAPLLHEPSTRIDEAPPSWLLEETPEKKRLPPLPPRVSAPSRDDEHGGGLLACLDHQLQSSPEPEFTLEIDDAMFGHHVESSPEPSRPPRSARKRRPLKPLKRQDQVVSRLKPTPPPFRQDEGMMSNLWKKYRHGDHSVDELKERAVDRSEMGYFAKKLDDLKPITPEQKAFMDATSDGVKALRESAKSISPQSATHQEYAELAQTVSTGINTANDASDYFPPAKVFTKPAQVLAQPILSLVQGHQLDKSSQALAVPAKYETTGQLEALSKMDKATASEKKWEAVPVIGKVRNLVSDDKKQAKIALADSVMSGLTEQDQDAEETRPPITGRDGDDFDDPCSS